MKHVLMILITLLLFTGLFAAGYMAHIAQSFYGECGYSIMCVILLIAIGNWIDTLLVVYSTDDYSKSNTCKKK